jgi:translation initiation factor 4E
LSAFHYSLYWQNLVLAVVGETLEDEVDKCLGNNNKNSSNKLNKDQDVINGVRVVDKSRGYPLYKLEIWMQSRDAHVKEKVHARLLDIVTDGQKISSSSTLAGSGGSQKKTTYPKFEWKDHSA